MSGHSKWSTIKRKKGVTDAARGKLFSKLIKSIIVAVKTGGGSNPDTNNKLRVAIDTAKAANMPKGNVERILSKAASSTENLEELVYEGFAPGNTSVVIDVATDNRNRTSQEIKQVLERGGGSMGGPGSVAFNFVSKGMLVVKKSSTPEEQMLSLIDVGVEDFEEANGDIEIFVDPVTTFETKRILEENGFDVVSAELIKKPVNTVNVSDAKTAKKVFDLLETLENQDDVQKVFCNIDVSDKVVKKVSSMDK